MKKNPLLTICVPTYNSARFLEKSLKSILNQDYPNFEVIVSDNASTDNTEEIVKSFSDKRTKFRKNPVTIGLTCANCNECMKEVKSEFMAFYHSDDIYEKDITTKEMDFLVSYPEAGAVFTLGVLIDENDKTISEFQLPRELRKKELYNFADIFKTLLKSGKCPIICPTFMTKKSVFNKVGLFKEKDFGRAADVEMWLRILKEYPIGILDENLIKYRVGKNKDAVKYDYLRTKKADFFSVMDHYIKNFIGQIESRLLRQYEYHKNYDDVIRARNLLMKNEISEARKLLNKSFPLSIFRAFFEDLGVNKIKSMVFRILLFVGVNIGLGKYLGCLLRKRLLSKQKYG